MQRGASSSAISIRLPVQMTLAIAELIDVPLAPPPPEDLYFSEGRKAWIVSRYRDVLAALRSTDLAQSRPPQPASDSNPGYDRTALPRFPSSKWQGEAKHSAVSLLQGLPKQCPIDLVAGFIRPWCLTSALVLTGIDPTHAGLLAELVKRLSESDAAPRDVKLKSRAREANNELDCIFQTSSTSSCKSMFLGTAQTVPTFLASAWAALLQHPTRVKQLQDDPGLMPRATEELLRCAGPVHTLFRYATSDIDISGNKIRHGDRLILRLASANRDPLQFQNPDCLDFTRDVAGHLALSYGPHYCSGALLVRLMTAVGIGSVLAQCSDVLLSSPVEWSRGTMLVWPASLPVVLGSAPRCREAGSLQ